MTDSALMYFVERELKYQARKQISNEIRKNCPEGHPMVTGVTVMLGTIVAMVVFSAMLRGGGKQVSITTTREVEQTCSSSEKKCRRGKGCIFVTSTRDCASKIRTKSRL